MRKYRTIPLFVMSTSAIISSIGYGSWIFNHFQEIEKEISTKNSQPVCYIQGNKAVKYTTIEKALAVAGDKDHINSSETIVVIPGTNPVISSSCTLDTKDTLLIPYEDETYMRDLSKITKADVGSVTSPNYSDNDLASVNKNRKNVVTINGKDSKGKSVSFTNNGKILVGGELGVGDSNQRPSGHTNGKYSQITIDDGAVIENNGSIEIYGYIKKGNKNGTGKLKSNSSSLITMPLVINDFKGGSYSAACNSRNVFPFNVFELVNCQCVTEFNTGAELSVMTAIYANDRIYVPEKSKLIAKTGALFNISSGKAVLDYRSYSFPYTKVDNLDSQDPSKISRMKISLNGAISFDSMSLSLAGNSLETGNFNVPLSYKFSISCLRGSVVTIKKPTKFLSGASLFVDDGASLTFESSSIFYQTYVDQSAYVSGKYPKKLGAATFVNDGNLTINSAFAGKILTSGSSGKTTTGDSFSASVTTDEIINVQSHGTKWTYRQVNGKANGNIKSSETETASTKQMVSNVTYIADDGAWIGQGTASDVFETVSSDQDGSCILPSALVLMADGSYKQAGLIRTGDMVMSFNHETGMVEPNVVIGNDDIGKPAQVYDVVHLEFSNGMSTDFIDEHGYFDVTLNKYVYLHIDDAEEYIGHEFVTIDEKGRVSRTLLVSASKRKMITRLAAPATANHLNLIIDGMLSMEGGLKGLFNIFDYDPKTLAFDKEKMQSDIRKYGLLTYMDFERFFPKEIYDLLPCKYLGVSIGKGLITWEIFESYVNKWKDQLMENVK